MFSDSDCVWSDDGSECVNCHRPNRRKNRLTRRNCPTAPNPRDKPVGPGTHLTTITKSLIGTSIGCGGCSGLAAQMNAWGVDGCRSLRQEIIDGIKANASTWKLDKLLAAMLRASISVLTDREFGFVNVLDPIGSLVDEAIRRASVTPEPLARCLRLERMPELAPLPLSRTSLEVSKLAASDTHLNGSIIEYGGKRLMAYRLHWVNSTIRLSDLGDDWQPVSDAEIKLPAIPQNTLANEDPRLFHWRGELWLQVSAVERQPYRTHIVYFRIDERGRVLATLIPQYAARREWEKNWAPFEHDGNLYAVYTIAPNHIVVKINPDGAVEKVSSVPFELPAALSNARGGAPPVLHNGEYYSWFHSVVKYNNQPTYLAGLYTFEAKPPFRPLRYVPSPMLDAQGMEIGKEGKSVVFPSGALVESGQWLVSSGLQDRWTELVRFNCDDVESVLLDVPANSVASDASR